MSKQIGIPQRLLLAGAAAAFVLTWSSGFIIATFGTDTAPVLTVLVWRYLVVGVILLIGLAGLRLRSGPVVVPAWRDIRPHLTIGLFAQFGYVLPIYLAVAAGVSAGTTALIDAVQPLVVATLVGPLLGLKVRRLQWLGLVLGAAGVLLIVLADASASVADSAAESAAPAAAYLLPLVALASLVSATFLERRTTARLSVAATLATHSTVALVAVTLLAAVTGTLAPPATPGFWVSTVLIAVFPTLIAYALYWYLLRRLGITALNALLYLVAPATAVAGTMLFGDPFTSATLAGLVLGAGAVALVIAPPRTPTPAFSDRARSRQRPAAPVAAWSPRRPPR